MAGFVTALHSRPISRWAIDPGINFFDTGNVCSTVYPKRVSAARRKILHAATTS